MTNQENAPPVANPIPEAARRLGISKSGCYNLISSGQLRTFKLGTRTLIAETELARFVEKRMEASAP